MRSRRFNLTARLQSLGYAFNGLKILLREEHNARIHAVAACVVLALGYMLQLSQNEWIAIILSIGFVSAAEALNSAIEALADYTCPEHNTGIKKVKDLAAAGVLIAALTALLIAVLIFIPKLYAMLV